MPLAAFAKGMLERCSPTFKKPISNRWASVVSFSIGGSREGLIDGDQ